ncbi:MAG: D-glycero-beta-D-manno-heptose-7-phosphate kinase [Deltaproteobacteria bacterium]
MTGNFEAIIGRFHRTKILVIGDLILDEYIWGKVDRISPEAPVPVIWANKRTYVPGGAANVANNIRSLGAQVCLVGTVGDDSNARIFLAELKNRKIGINGIFIESKRHTTVKTRVIAGHQQIVRVDWEHTHPLSGKLNSRISGFIAKNISDFDGVIIEDYGKGVINTGLLNEVIALAHRHKKIITVDPKEEHFQYYRGATTITPNRKELENAVRDLKIRDTTNTFQVHNDRLSTDNDIELAARQVLKYLDLESLLVTLGENGMSLFEKNGRVVHIPTVAQEVFDVSGAGDTVAATFTLALSCRAKKIEAAHIANFAAGIVVSKLGTAVTSRKELLEKIRNA